MRRRSSVTFPVNWRRDSLTKSLDGFRRVIVVSYRVPAPEDISRRVDSSFLNSGLTAAVDCLAQKGSEIVWIGHKAKDLCRSSGCIDFEEDESISPYPNLKIVPVALRDSHTLAQFRSFSKGVLWPLFHYYGSVKSYSRESWQGYCDVNVDFAKAILKEYQLGDLIFIQDYHLMMVPKYLRDLLPSAKIGYFLHTPFPSSELYRSLPVRDLILRSLINCDIMGFQAYSFARHFMSACTRILGLTVNENGVETENGHFVTCEVLPIGINPEKCFELLRRDDVQKKMQSLRELYKGKKIIVARDGTEIINGIPQKLRAFETFMKTYPEYKDKVVFIQICRPSPTTGGAFYEELSEQIDKLVGSINGQYGNIVDCPLVYLNQNMPFEDICAMLAVADVGLITPIRDGMNVTAFEFTACQENKMSPIVLSEFAGAAGCLGGSILVNPHYEKKVAKGLYEALNMTDDYKKLRHKANFDYVMKHNALYWISQFLKLLTQTDSSRFNFAPSLSLDELHESYNESTKRMMFLDYDGTLTPKKRLPQEATPAQEVIELLQILAKDVKNNIYIVSGRDRKFLEEYFVGLRVGLAAEHGNFVRKVPKPGDENKFVWEERTPNMDMRWKEDVMKIFENVTDFTPGSLVEEKEINVTWHYRNADPEFAEWQKNELLVHLQGLPKSPIDILVGSKCVEVRPQGVNKGTFVKGIMTQESNVDFVLCIGDDKTDEDMFQELKQYDIERSFSIAVEKKPTLATSYLESQSDVVTLLKNLAQMIKERR